MEHGTADAQGAPRAAADPIAATVEGVADQRAAERGEVDADLVRASGLGHRLDEGEPAGEARDDGEPGAGRAAAVDDGLRLAAGAAPGERRVDGAFGRHPVHQGQIAAAHRPC